MAEQRGHLAHGGKAGRGLQPLLGGARDLLHAALLADVDEGAHPARVLALGVDQRRLEDQHGKTRAVLAHENAFMALARWRLRARPALVSPPGVLLGKLGRPVGRDVQAQQFLGAEADHLAERGVDVGDAALQVARAHARDHRVLHGLAERQRIAKIMLGTQAPPVVAHQHHEHRDQGDRHYRDQGRHDVGEHAGRTVPAVHAQHQGGAGQVEQLLGREHARAAPGRPDHGQARTVGLGEGHFLGARQGLAYLGVEQGLQAIRSHDETCHMAALGQGQAHLHHLHAHALGHQLEIARRIGRALEPSGIGAGQRGLMMGRRLIVPQHIAVWRIGKGAQTQACVAPLHAHQLALDLQQLGRMDLPLGGLIVRRIERQQILQVAIERDADVRNGQGRIALQLVLDLGGLVTPRQPDHGDQHAGHEPHQCRPQRPATPGRTPAAPGPGLARGRLCQTGRTSENGLHGVAGRHSTRCESAGSCERHCSSCSRTSSPTTRPGPSACSDPTCPQGSTSMLWPQVRRPFSCLPPCAGAST